MIKIALDGLLLSIQFLTSIPLRKEIAWDPKRATASVAMYPLVGFILGFLLFFQAYALMYWTPLSHIVIAAWLTTYSILFSGGLHLDGWADVCDALYSRKSREEKLVIMKDPRIGTFAMIAVILLLAWRFLFIVEVMQMNEYVFLFALILIPFLVRLFFGWQLMIGSFAKKDGLGAALQVAKNSLQCIVYVIWTMIAFILIAYVYPPFMYVLVGGIVFLLCWQRWMHIQFGGMTGDTIGAGGEGGENVLWAICWSVLLFGTA